LGRWGRITRAGRPLLIGCAHRQCSASTGSATSIARFVGHDLQQPWPERGTETKPTERRVGLDERILGNVLRLVGVTADQVGGAGSVVLVPLEHAPLIL